MHPKIRGQFLEALRAGIGRDDASLMLAIRSIRELSAQLSTERSDLSSLLESACSEALLDLETSDPGTEEGEAFRHEIGRALSQLVFDGMLEYLGRASTASAPESS